MNSPIHAQQKKTQEIKLINTNNLLMDYEFFDHLKIVQKLLLKGSKFTEIKDCENILNQLLEQITVIEQQFYNSSSSYQMINRIECLKIIIQKINYLEEEFGFLKAYIRTQGII